MKQKTILQICILLFYIFLSSCTIRFEAEKLKLDADPIEGKIGSIEKVNTTYKLVAIDVLKNAGPEKTRSP